MNTKLVLMACATVLTTSLCTTSLQAQESQMKADSAVQRWTHGSGATVILIEKHDFPFVTFGVTLRSGALWDPADKTGLASVTAELMMRGAGTRDRATLTEELDHLGSEMEVSTAHTALSWDGDALKRNLDPVMDILADIILRPTFPEEELAKLKREKRSDILRTHDKDRSLNRKFFRRTLFGTHPQGRPADGTLAGYTQINRTDVQAFFADHVHADNIIFGFSGDLTKDELNALLDRHFAKLPKGNLPALNLPDLPSLKGRQVLLVDKPERTQNQIVIGHLAPPATSPDQYALTVVNTVFGGTFTARLNHEIRDARGLAYGAYSYINSDRVTGTYRLFTYPAAQDGMKALGLLISLYEELHQKGLTQEEIDFAQSYLINSFAFEIDTPDNLLTEVIRSELEGRGTDHVATYIDRIRAVTLKDANRVIREHLDPNNFLLVMLCVAAGFEEPVQALPGVTTVKVVPHDAKF